MDSQCKTVKPLTPNTDSIIKSELNIALIFSPQVDIPDTENVLNET